MTGPIRFADTWSTPLDLIRRERRRWQRVALAGIAVAFLAGLLAGRASATPRPAPVIPAAPSFSGHGEPDQGRTEAPLSMGTSPAPTISRPEGQVTARSSGASLAGIATWFCLAGRSPCTRGYPDGLYAAAGPALRAWLGADWRGQQVTVTADGRSVVVTLVDWCRCGGGRIIDLYAAAFRTLAPLSRGVLRVTLSAG